MQEVLFDLNQEMGIKGSAILTKDGVLVASEIGPPINPDVVAGVSSSVIQLINAGLARMGVAPFTRFVFNAKYGKMVFYDTGEAYLVVVLDKNINTDLVMMPIQSSARKIQNLGSM